MKDYKTWSAGSKYTFGTAFILFCLLHTSADSTVPMAQNAARQKHTIFETRGKEYSSTATNKRGANATKKGAEAVLNPPVLRPGPFVWEVKYL